MKRWNLNASSGGSHSFSFSPEMPSPEEVVEHDQLLPCSFDIERCVALARLVPHQFIADVSGIWFNFLTERADIIGENVSPFSVAKSPDVRQNLTRCANSVHIRSQKMQHPCFNWGEHNGFILKPDLMTEGIKTDGANRDDRGWFLTHRLLLLWSHMKELEYEYLSQRHWIRWTTGLLYRFHQFHGEIYNYLQASELHRECVRTLVKDELAYFASRS
jgi:hypothetical protein